MSLFLFHVSLGLTESDMLKLWKGLFYCMWMSDKPKVQVNIKCIL